MSITMIKGVVMPGPCLACGATGKWDPHFDNDPEDFIECEFCSGTGYNSRNYTSIERKTGETKLGKIIKILNDFHTEYLNHLVGEHDDDEDVDKSRYWYMYKIHTEKNKAIHAIYLAHIIANGCDLDITKHTKSIIKAGWEEFLSTYNWQYDMNFKNLEDVIEGGSGWQIFKE